MRNFKLLIHIVIALCLLGLPLAGCAKAGNKPDTAKPPVIPPKASFVMDFNDFMSAGNVTLLPDVGGSVQQVSYRMPGIDSSNRLALGDYRNFGFAALNVGLWNSIIFVGLAVPVTAFVESFNHTPVQQPDYTWVWNYSVTVQGATYTAELHGKYTDNGVRWDMYVSKENEYSDFLWYYGESDLPATQGYWVLKNKPAEPTDLVRIDWHRNLAEETGDIKYTNIIPGGAENRGYISYGKTQSSYGHFYDIYNKGQDNHTNIEWDPATKEGRVKDARHFSDGDWHCWDADHKDIVCRSA